MRNRAVGQALRTGSAGLAAAGRFAGWIALRRRPFEPTPSVLRVNRAVARFTKLTWQQ